MILKTTHLLPQHFLQQMWSTWNIYIYVCFNIYIYYSIFVIQLPMHLSRITATPDISKPVVSLGGVFSLQEIIRLTATTDIFQACSESKWVDSLQETIRLTATADIFQACNESGWCGSLQEIIF